MELIGDFERTFAAMIYPNRVTIAIASNLDSRIPVVGDAREPSLSGSRRDSRSPEA